MNLAKEFDGLSNNYTSDIQRWVPYYREMIEAIGNNLPSGFKPNRILDLGCGNGNVTALLHHRFPDANFTLLDASEEMIKACRERFSDHRFTFSQGYFQDTLFRENTFDLVGAGLSLHHLTGEEKRQLFQKVFRCLSPEACFSFSDLLIEKEDEPFHSTHLKRWESMAKEKGTTQEEWNWMMEHYDTFDHPNGLEEQLKWLHLAGFSTVSTTFRKIGWTNVLARK